MSITLTRRVGRSAAAVVATSLGLTALAVSPVHADTQSSGTASATVSDTVVGSAIHVSGTGWTTTAGNNGSTIGVKIDESTTVPASGTVANPTDNQPDTPFTKPIWAAISADASGSFSADITFPTPSNTSPAIGAGDWAAGTTHTLRLLSGSMEKDDVARTMQLTFTVTAASTDPGTGTTDPGTGTTNPGTTNPGTGAGTTDPGAGTTGPGTGTSDPGTGGTDPGTGTPVVTTTSHAAAVVAKDKAVIKKLQKKLKKAHGAQKATLKKKLAKAKKQLKRDQKAAR